MGQTVITRKSGGGSAGAVIDEIVESYVVQTGNTITAGTFVDYLNTFSKGSDNIFQTNITLKIDATVLSETKVLVCYQDQNSSDFGKAVVLEISGDTVTNGTSVVFNSAVTFNLSVTTIDSTKALVVYRNGGNSNRGTAMVLSISGTTITTNSSLAFATTAITNISVTMIDTNKAITTFRNDGDSGRSTARVLEISGTTVSASGSNLVYNTGDCNATSVKKLETNKALVAYQSSGGVTGTATVLTVSGTTITSGTNFVYQATGNHGDPATVDLSSSKVLVAYRNGDNAGFGTTRVLSVSGTTITAGLSFVFRNADCDFIRATIIQNNKVAISFNSNSLGNIVLLNINETTISFSDYYGVVNVNVFDSDIVALNSNKLLYVYRNASVSNRGYANAITITKKIVNTTSEKVFGLAKTGGAADSTIEVYVNS
jgi:hypothetical protein